jgi:hypothetical protein
MPAPGKMPAQGKNGRDCSGRGPPGRFTLVDLVQAILVIMLQVLGYVLSTFDFALWLLTFGPVKLLLKLFKSQPKILPVDDKPDAPRRRVTGKKELQGKPVPEISTLYEIMVRSGRVFADRPCVGTRIYLKEGTADASKGQRFPPKVFGETMWLTYKETAERMKAFGSGLRYFKLQPQPQLKSGQSYNDLEGDFMLIIYENT